MCQFLRAINPARYGDWMWSVWLACVRPEPVPAGAAPLDPEVIAALSMTRVRDDVRWIADESVGGRVPGTPGHDLVRDWLASEMALAGLEPVDGSFVVEVPLEPERARLGLDAAGQVFEVPLVGVGANLFGVRPGVDPALADEVVLLVAHYDHLGVDPSGDAYNGAFDDAAAVCALLELARALDAAHATFARTVAFLFTDAEEDGLDGAVAWVGSPTVPLPDVVAALSVDPIGRPLLADYGPLFVIGAERSERLQAAVDLAGARAGAVTTRLNRTPMIGYASDQDAFWDAPDPVPALWISSGGMSFYHTVDDTPDTIDYGSVRAHLGVVAQLAAELAAGGERPVDRGPQPLSVDDLEQAVATLDGALGSAELTAEERAVGQGFRDTLAGAAAAGDVGPSAFTSYVEMLLYVIAELTPAHPGPIPPPFPG